VLVPYSAAQMYERVERVERPDRIIIELRDGPFRERRR